MTNVASSAGSMASSRESSVSGRASSVTAIKAEPIEISLTPATVTWSKRTSNAQNLPTTTRVKSEPLDFQLPTATQTLLNKHGTSKGKKSGRVGSSKGNQNVALKTCEVDQKNGSMMVSTPLYAHNCGVNMTFRTIRDSSPCLHFWKAQIPERI
jgi:hypothetical protein